MRTPEPCLVCQGPSSPAHTLPPRPGVQGSTGSRGGEAASAQPTPCLAQNRGKILPCVNSSLGTVAQSGLSSPAALQTPQGAQAELRVSATRLGYPFLSTISSYSPSQTREKPPLLSCSHPYCLVPISTCAWLAQGSPGVSTSQTVPGRQEPAQTCQGSFTFEMSSAWLWFRVTGSWGDSMHCPVTAGTPSSTKTSVRQGWQPSSPVAHGPGTASHCLSPR